MKDVAKCLVCLLAVDCLFAGSALADSVFTISDPPVACGVIDMVPFDGIGDSGPYELDTVILGTEGEKRGMAEFDIAPFAVPAGEYISAATFRVQVYSDYCGGLGAPFGLLPETLAVDGYAGNGVEDLSDFEAGAGNFLDSVDSSSVQYLTVLSFDVTDFVIELVDVGHAYAGFTVRAEQIGSLSIWDGLLGYPKLTINTTTLAWAPGDLNCDGLVNAFDIDPFVLALTDPPGYETAHADCEIYNADINDDGLINAFDIDPFVLVLTGGGN